MNTTEYVNPDVCTVHGYYDCPLCCCIIHHTPYLDGKCLNCEVDTLPAYETRESTYEGEMLARSKWIRESEKDFINSAIARLDKAIDQAVVAKSLLETLHGRL